MKIRQINRPEQEWKYAGSFVCLANWHDVVLELLIAERMNAPLKSLTGKTGNTAKTAKTGKTGKTGKTITIT